ncbi:TIGR02281 family clan AA aspartic protease [Cupriavidus malaysiensis]|uniref:Tetratricopeptide repeat protein n=1 Tax=Cupriavidus malaysiensis TaxID=367825 RepID=A0ABM6FD82_9BURK|nr:TIGR02281 family clan AA aspartic protease [Cupriavidus malaysiensis]AOZ09754.1 hypothetical protein BKK80_29075 [Cupriavidus malaysiensis]
MPLQRSRQRGQRLPLAAMLLSCAMLAAACSEEPAGASVPIARYGLATVPGSVLAGTPARQPLERLTREPCDIEAASALSRALAEAGYRREAAGLRLAFAGNCPRGRDLLPGAIPLLQAIGDNAGALQVAERLVASDPDHPQWRFLRAEALRESGKPAEALDDYLAVLSLVPDLSRVSSAVFLGAAEARAGTGKPCEAGALVRMWIGGDPGRRDTPRARALVERYQRQGACQPAKASAAQTFARPRNGLIVARATVNGREGRFIVDTGASFVALSEDFARRAGIPLAQARRIRVQTANGPAGALLSEAATVTLGTAQAAAVPTAVMSGGGAALGPDIDGLLGQSFLSQFEVSFRPDRWTIGPLQAAGR